MQKTGRIFTLVFLAFGVPFLYGFVNSQSANVVIGHQLFTTGNYNDASIDASNMQQPRSVFYDSVKNNLYVADYENSRVLIYNNASAPSRVTPRLMSWSASLPLTSYGTNQGLGTPTNQTLDGPSAVCSDGVNLYIADTANNRVLVYNPIPTSNDAAASTVIGQASFAATIAAASQTGLSNPYGLITSGGQLYVADSGNNRVLIYNISTLSATGSAAASVLGQGSSFTTSNANQGTTPSGGYAECSRNGLRRQAPPLVVADDNSKRTFTTSAIC